MKSDLTLRAFSPSDPPRIDARADFAAEHAAMGEPLFGMHRPDGVAWTLTAGPRKWDRPLACGGLEPQGHGRFVGWLYAAELDARGWVLIRRAFRAMIRETRARRVELTVRQTAPAGWPLTLRACGFAEALGLKREGLMRGFGPDGSDYILFGGVFQ